MYRNLPTLKILWTITTVLTMIAAGVGIISPHIYQGLFPKEFTPGALPQDILTFILCLFLLYLIKNTKLSAIKLQILITGVIGSFFYLYGIFTMERVYNYLYILYAAIFALSFWSLLYSLMHLDETTLAKVKLPSGITKVSSIIGISITVLFNILWIAALLPLMRDHHQIDNLYSIYILDLCFIMPAFLITSVLSLQKRSLGALFLPAVYIVGFFVIFPLGLAEIAKPFYGLSINIVSMLFSFIFSAIMLIVGAYHLYRLRFMDGSN